MQDGADRRQNFWTTLQKCCCFRGWRCHFFYSFDFYSIFLYWALSKVLLFLFCVVTMYAEIQLFYFLFYFFIFHLHFCIEYLSILIDYHVCKSSMSMSNIMLNSNGQHHHNPNFGLFICYCFIYLTGLKSGIALCK